MDISKLNEADLANAGYLLDAVLRVWPSLPDDARGRILDAAERQAYDRGERGETARMNLILFVSDSAALLPAFTRTKEAETALAKMNKSKRDAARYEHEYGQLSSRR